MARQSRAPSLLLTRPAPQSQRFAQAVIARLGPMPVVISPLMQARFLQPRLPDLPFEAVLFTSETGVEAALALPGHLPKRAFCVGDRTAAAAGAAGFDAVSAKGDASALCALVLDSGCRGPLLHLRGEDSAGDLAETVTNCGIVTCSATIYRQQAVPFSAAALALLASRADILIPLFSPRSARLFLTALPKDCPARLWVAAISPATAAVLMGLNAKGLMVAARPDGENMLHAVAELQSLCVNA